MKSFFLRFRFKRWLLHNFIGCVLLLLYSWWPEMTVKITNIFIIKTCIHLMTRIFFFVTRKTWITVPICSPLISNRVMGFKKSEQCLELCDQPSVGIPRAGQKQRWNVILWFSSKMGNEELWLKIFCKRKVWVY